jgi:hypothetical protein
LSEARLGDAERESQTEQLVVDGDGRRYRLEPVAGTKAIPDLRWVMRDGSARSTTLSLREVIGRVQSYEPARSLTSQALLGRARRPCVSVSLLRGELERVDGSRIVLNRGLREAVLGALAGNGLTASEIAIRCGRTKRDARGNVTGETSWVARRVGLAPEGGGSVPTPWILSDVLALIARCGLGVSPREVELG